MEERCVALIGHTIKVKVKAQHYVLAGAGINSPVLLRSNAADLHNRTFLHLVNFSAQQFDQIINPFYGAPQLIYSEHFQWQDGTTSKIS